MAYLTVQQYRSKSMLPLETLDAIETRQAGWTAEQLELVSSRIYAQLGKRYKQWLDAAKYPTVLGEWIARIMDVRALLKRGVNPEDQQYVTLKEFHDDAWKEITQAANGESGLLDLPAEEGGAVSGIVRGGPLAYSESSPYVAFDNQSEVGHQEDTNKGGTSFR